MQNRLTEEVAIQWQNIGNDKKLCRINEKIVAILNYSKQVVNISQTSLIKHSVVEVK